MALPDQDTALALLRQMLRIRRFEDRCAQLYSAGKIRGFLHLYNGEEAIAAGIIPLLDAKDAILATYREHGHALARGVDMGAVMAEMYGKQEGCSRGRGGSMHLFDAGTRFYGGNAIVAGALPLAVGLALADKLQNRAHVSVCFFGEGAAAEGEFHESLNLAALWQLPVLFVCENNLYAMGTALARSEAETDIHLKARGYGLHSAAVDGMDLLAVREAATVAIGHVRAGNGPYLLECHTYRFRAHSMFDSQLYRDKAEVAQWQARDPIDLYERELLNLGLIEAGSRAALEAEVEAEVEAAVAFAEAGTWEPVEQLTRDVYTQPAA
ncbi:pyruvate dehydrogenase (acetyl-transferring) E1 component subunit alpha [Immundisolibacter sp.]|uniref:pyruvate dehydrogenase (acetyl-transferring) E1 component subunit alpha n=1 Tax=Immundisolibacter sp. TaxID=1934948 RepID=UPI003567AE22